MIQLIVEYSESTCDGSLRNGSTFVCGIVMFSVWESSFCELPFQKHKVTEVTFISITYHLLHLLHFCRLGTK